MRKYLILCFLAIISCTNIEKDRKYIITRNWKFVEGYNVGDVMGFDHGVFSIDTQMNIYKKGVNVGAADLLTDDCLEIISLDGEEGIYVDL